MGDAQGRGVTSGGQDGRLTVNVADRNTTVQALGARGGRRAPQPTWGTARGWAARFVETEGNEVGLRQGDPDAA